MRGIPEVIDKMFTQAFGFPTSQCVMGPVNGQYLVEYVWFVELHHYAARSILVGVSAVIMNEKFQRMPLWKRGLILLDSQRDRLHDGQRIVVHDPIDLKGQDFVADALQSLCVLPTNFMGTSLGDEDPNEPGFNLYVYAPGSWSEIVYEGYNDTPGYKAFWDVLVHTVDRYLTLYDDPKLYQEIREAG
jgi:hypothetical protein